MLFKRSVAAALLSWLLVFAASAQSDPAKGETLFLVNNKPVMIEEFIYLFRKNHQRDRGDFTKEKMEEYLKLFINYKLKVEEAISRGMDTTAVFKKEYTTYRNELLKPYLPDSKVIDSLVALTYERLKEEVNASHILIALKPDALPEDTLEAFKRISALRKRALAGERFADLAARYSEEPGAETTAGNLGFFTAMQMVFPFEQAAYTTPVGGVSQPVRTQFGYHIIHVLDRQPARGEVEVSHIMIRTGNNADNEKAKNTIFDLHDQLQKGMDWRELCQRYSEDANSKENGGRLRPFGVGAMASVPEFEEMAFSLKEQGEISDPIQTQFGWHILRLEAKIPLPPFEDLKASLTQRVSRDERVTISRDALREKLKKELGYSENTDVKRELLNMPDSTILSPQWNRMISESTGEAVLFTMQDTPFRVKDFIAYVHEGQRGGIKAAENMSQLFTQYTEAVQINMLEEKVKQQSPDYRWLLKEYYEGILLFEIMEKEVWNKAMDDTVGQRNYFKAHATDYHAGERIAGTVYSSTSQQHLEELQNLLGSSDSAVSAFLAKHKIRQESGPFEKQDRVIFSKISWSPGLHVTSNNGIHYLVWVKKILPPGPKTFEEARASVISDYQSYLEESWIRKLNAKFGVKIRKKAKKEAFQLLTQNQQF